MYTTALGTPCEAEPGTPVDHNDFPVWLHFRLIEAMEYSDDHYGDICSLEKLSKEEGCGADWLDHCGTTVCDGRLMFVCEPYLNIHGDYSGLRRLAEMLDCELVVSEKSYWYPGKTIRLGLVPKEDTK